MKETDFAISFENLSKAFSRLQEGIRESSTPLNQDGDIQRFEFTYELLWKTLKLLFFENGVECKSPRECFKEAFRLGLIINDKTYLEMITDRNTTVHVYSDIESVNIYSRIKTEYVNAMNDLINEIQKYVQRTY